MNFDLEFRGKLNGGWAHGKRHKKFGDASLHPRTFSFDLS